MSESTQVLMLWVFISIVPIWMYIKYRIEVRATVADNIKYRTEKTVMHNAVKEMSEI